MLTGWDGQIRIGVLHAAPDQFAHIERLAAEFRWHKPELDAVAEVGLERFDIYLVVVNAQAGMRGQDDPTPGTAPDGAAHGEMVSGGVALGTLVMQAARTPCLVLGTHEEGVGDDAIVAAALNAGATDFLPLPGLAAPDLERAVHFSLARRRAADALTAREACLAAARERDRQQLANALHDGPLQDLIGARFLLGALAAGDSPSDITEDIQSSLQQVIHAIRTLCSDLKPPALGPFGLEKAIRAHMQAFQTRSPDLEVTLELDVDHQVLPEWVRFALFRVFQAAVANVAEHAQAAHMWVRWVVDHDDVRLTVADDGQGFDLPASWLDFARTERCGLLLMQERVDALQGRMVVQSTPGSGTRVMVQVPRAQPLLPIPAYLASAVPDRNG